MTMADRIVVLHDGLIEQMGSPWSFMTVQQSLRRRLHRFAVHEHVQGHAPRRPSAVFETKGGTRLPLAAIPPGSDGLDAVYGIRPEHLILGGETSTQVTVIEPTVQRRRSSPDSVLTRLSACSASVSRRSPET